MIRPAYTKDYVFLGLGVLACVLILIFVFSDKKHTSPPQDATALNEAYQRAYQLWITTIPNIKDAHLDWPVYRKSAAKMAAVFAQKVIGLTPDEDRTCDFKDISKEIPELQEYIVLSCKLGIMGLDYYGNPETIFNPNYIVTRDQLVTILSRILFGNTYNITPGELSFSDKAKNFFIHSVWNISKAVGIIHPLSSSHDRYTKHLDVIKKLWVMTDYTPSIQEFKGTFMLIMYKLDQMGMSKIQKLIK